jgi:hypothetical protein
MKCALMYAQNATLSLPANKSLSTLAVALIALRNGLNKKAKNKFIYADNCG